MYMDAQWAQVLCPQAVHAGSQSPGPSVRCPRAISGRVRLICQPAVPNDRQVAADPYNHRYSPVLCICLFVPVTRGIVLEYDDAELKYRSPQDPSPIRERNIWLRLMINILFSVCVYYYALHINFSIHRWRNPPSTRIILDTPTVQVLP